jgi:hypothetical protein
MGSIYAIRYVPTGADFYVGQTRVPPEQRWREHWRGRTPVSQALRFVGAHEDFDFRVIETANDHDLSDREQYWIERLGTLHARGLNCRASGNFRYVSAATKAKMAEAKRRQWADPEFRVKAAVWLKTRKPATVSGVSVRPSDFGHWNQGLKRSAETREKLSEITKRRWADPAARAKMTEAKVGTKASEETKRKMSEAQRKRPPQAKESYAKGWETRRKNKEVST